MIALIISNDEYSINQLSSFLKKKTYDIIIYKDFIKAMDNLFEIKPSLIITSCQEYPRHWKVMATFLNVFYELKIDYSNASTFKPALVLLNEDLENKEISQEAGKLGVKGIFNSCSDQGLSSLNQIISQNQQSSIQVQNAEFLFSNPFTDLLVTGSVENLCENKITFLPDILTHTMQISTGTILKNCTLKSEDHCKSVRAHVLSVQTNEPYAMEIQVDK